MEKTKETEIVSVLGLELILNIEEKRIFEKAQKFLKANKYKAKNLKKVLFFMAYDIRNLTSVGRAVTNKLLKKISTAKKEKSGKLKNKDCRLSRFAKYWSNYNVGIIDDYFGTAKKPLKELSEKIPEFYIGDNKNTPLQK